MVNSWLVIYSMTMYLLISDVKSYIINNDLNLNGHVKRLASKPSQGFNEDSKKVLNMVTYHASDDVSDVNPRSYLDTNIGFSEVLDIADRKPVTPIRRNYLTNIIFDDIRAISWRVVKFFICNVFSSRVACTVMNMLSDEGEGGLSTPEGVAQGLRFIEDVIEMYHLAQKRST